MHRCKCNSKQICKTVDVMRCKNNEHIKQWLFSLVSFTFSGMYSKLFTSWLECKEVRWWNVMSFLTSVGNLVKLNLRSWSLLSDELGFSSDFWEFSTTSVCLRARLCSSISVGFLLLPTEFCAWLLPGLFIQGYLKTAGFGFDVGKVFLNFALWASSSARIAAQSVLLADKCFPLTLTLLVALICLFMLGTVMWNLLFGFPSELGELFDQVESELAQGTSSDAFITDGLRSGTCMASCWATDRHWFQYRNATGFWALLMDFGLGLGVGGICKGSFFLTTCIGGSVRRGP